MQIFKTPAAPGEKAEKLGVTDDKMVVDQLFHTGLIGTVYCVIEINEEKEYIVVEEFQVGKANVWWKS